MRFQWAGVVHFDSYRLRRDTDADTQWAAGMSDRVRHHLTRGERDIRRFDAGDLGRQCMRETTNVARPDRVGTFERDDSGVASPRRYRSGLDKALNRQRTLRGDTEQEVPLLKRPVTCGALASRRSDPVHRRSHGSAER